MKKFLFIILCLGAFSCYSADVKKEYPQSLNLDKYKTIHLGWIEFPVSKWRAYRYNNAGEWQKAIYDLNANVLKKYFKSALPGNRKILGPSRGNPRTGDLFIKFDYLSYEANFVGGQTAADRLNLRVEMYDLRRGRKIYSAVLGLDSYRPGPGDWSVYRLEGRMAMEIRNLADFIGSKF
jgi:hypothetical protein